MFEGNKELSFGKQIWYDDFDVWTSELTVYFRGYRPYLHLPPQDPQLQPFQEQTKRSMYNFTNTHYKKNSNYHHTPTQNRTKTYSNLRLYGLFHNNRNIRSSNLHNRKKTLTYSIRMPRPLTLQWPNKLYYFIL